MAELAPPSPFFLDQLDRIRESTHRGAVLDIACGLGRHCIALAEAGIGAIGIDRNRDYLASLRDVASQRRLAVQTVVADLEAPAEIPFASRCCGVALVFRYLHRPLSKAIARVLAPGALLVYETFTTGQIELGYGPRNPEHLLARGELRQLFSDLEILEYWEGVRPDPRPAALARLVARARA